MGGGGGEGPSLIINLSLMSQPLINSAVTIFRDNLSGDWSVDGTVSPPSWLVGYTFACLPINQVVGHTSAQLARKPVSETVNK